jgi:hypothetical protein
MSEFHKKRTKNINSSCRVTGRSNRKIHSATILVK